MKENLRKYTDQELSLHVFNDEYLYDMRHNNKKLLSTLRECFLYTSDQLEVLKEDLEADQGDNNGRDI